MKNFLLFSARFSIHSSRVQTLKLTALHAEHALQYKNAKLYDQRLRMFDIQSSDSREKLLFFQEELC